MNVCRYCSRLPNAVPDDAMRAPKVVTGYQYVLSNDELPDLAQGLQYFIRGERIVQSHTDSVINRHEYGPGAG